MRRLVNHRPTTVYCANDECCYYFDERQHDHSVNIQQLFSLRTIEKGELGS